LIMLGRVYEALLTPADSRRTVLLVRYAIDGSR
jgi:hypothetical protein